MQTNHLSHFLLTKLLIPKLEQAAEKYGEARVVSHSSVARHQQKDLKSKYLERRGGKLGGDGASMFGVFTRAKSARDHFLRLLEQRTIGSTKEVKKNLLKNGMTNLKP